MTPALVADGQRFAVRLGLGVLDTEAEEVTTGIAGRLDEYRPRLTSRRDGHLVLSMTIVAADLWLALLLAMAGVTDSGYPPSWIEAEPTTNAG